MTNYPHQSGSPDFDGAEAFEHHLKLSEFDRCHALIGKFYEMPIHEMDGGLTIVSLPGWMVATDIDLIKKALQFYASQQGDRHG
jgi:hypothetical protein